MGLASPRNHSKIDIKIIQNQIFKDFKYDFLWISREAIPIKKKL